MIKGACRGGRYNEERLTTTYLIRKCMMMKMSLLPLSDEEEEDPEDYHDDSTNLRVGSKWPPVLTSWNGRCADIRHPQITFNEANEASEVSYEQAKKEVQYLVDRLGQQVYQYGLCKDKYVDTSSFAPQRNNTRSGGRVLTNTTKMNVFVSVMNNMMAIVPML